MRREAFMYIILPTQSNLGERMYVSYSYCVEADKAVGVDMHPCNFDENSGMVLMEDEFVQVRVHPHGLFKRIS